MEITKEWLKEKEACSEGLEWFIHQSETDLFKLIDKLIKKRKDWANWLIIKAMNRQQQLQYAIACAKLVLPIFEEKYPADARPRDVIEATQKLLTEDSEKNRDAAYKASGYDPYWYFTHSKAILAAKVAYAASDTNVYWATLTASSAINSWKPILQIGINILKGNN